MKEELSNSIRIELMDCIVLILNEHRIPTVLEYGRFARPNSGYSCGFESCPPPYVEVFEHLNKKYLMDQYHCCPEDLDFLSTVRFAIANCIPLTNEFLQVLQEYAIQIASPCNSLASTLYALKQLRLDCDYPPFASDRGSQSLDDYVNVRIKEIWRREANLNVEYDKFIKLSKRLVPMLYRAMQDCISQHPVAAELEKDLDSLRRECGGKIKPPANKPVERKPEIRKLKY